MMNSTCLKSVASLLLTVGATVLLSGCGAGEVPADTPRLASGSANKQGLWRMVEDFDGEKFYSTMVIQGTGNSVTMTDCSRAFETDAMRFTSGAYTGYNHDLAPLTVLNNDTMRWIYLNQTRNFEKMDVDPQFDMGQFSLKSPLLPDVASAKLACVQFSKNHDSEVMVLATRVLGNSLLITINMKDRFRVGTFAIDPHGAEDAMVILTGSHWVMTTLSPHDEVSTGTLTIKKRGNVWIEGELSGVLGNGSTPVRVAFNVETPVR